MITQRDLKILKFIDEFNVAHTSTLERLFYPSLRVAQNRLAELVQMKELNRERYYLKQEYIYFKKKPVQLRHSLLLTDFYRELVKCVGDNVVGNIVFKKEYQGIEGIRPDGLVVWKNRNNGARMYFVEIEISKKGFDYEKYKKAFIDDDCWKDVFPEFPDVIVVTDEKIGKNKMWDGKDGKFKVHIVGTDLMGLGDFI